MASRRCAGTVVPFSPRELTVPSRMKKTLELIGKRFAAAFGVAAEVGPAPNGAGLGVAGVTMARADAGPAPIAVPAAQSAVSARNPM